MSSFDFQPDSQQVVPEMPPPQGRIGPFTIGIILCTLVLIGLWAGWDPASKAYHAWRAGRNAGEVQAAIMAEDWPNAYRLLTEARRKDPEETAVIEVAVAFLKATKSDPAGLAQQMQRLELKRPLSDEERLLLGRSLIMVGKVAEARQIHDELPLSVSTRPAGLQLLSAVLAAEGHAKEARTIGDRATAGGDVANDSEAAVKLSQQEKGSAFPEVRQGAKERLWEVAAGADASALEAIAALAADSTLHLAEARRLLALVEKHPLIALPMRLAVMSAVVRLQPEQAAHLYRQEVERFQREGNGMLEEMAFWLMKERQDALVFELVPAELALKSRELYPILMQTLGQAGRWKELRDLLTAANAPVPRSLVDLALAEVQARLEPDMRESRRLLEGTVKVAAKDGSLGTLKAAAELAAKLDLPDVAASAYLQAGLKAATGATTEDAVHCLQKSTESALIAKDTAILLDASRKLQELSPGSAAYADRLAYLRLILGVEMETVDVSGGKGAHDLQAVFTVALERVPPALLQALAAYRLGDVEGVKKHLASISGASGLPAGQRAVVAGLLALAGKADRAWEIAEKVPDAVLLREELAFLQHAR